MRPYTSRLATFDTPALRRVVRGVRIGLAMRPDPVRRTGERHGGAGSIEQLTRKLAAIWNELDRRGEMERIMEDERQDDVETGAELEYCLCRGCIDMARRDGLCPKHLVALAKGDKEAAEAVRKWHAVHDRHVEPPRDAHWRTYPEKEPEACSLEPFSQSQENTTMGKSKKYQKIACGKCGLLIDERGFGRHRAACKGPRPTTFPCPICGKGHKNQHALHCHQGHTGHGQGEIVAMTPKKRKYTRRAKAGAGDILVIGNSRSAILHTKGQTRNQDPPAAAAYPAPAIEMLGHAFIRLAELVGLAEILANYPHPDGLVFVNTTTGKQALLTAAGEIEAVELTRRPKANG